MDDGYACAHFGGLENVCVYERGRKGASKQLMDWCSLFFFLSCSWAGIHLHMYNTRKRASKLCCLFSLLGNINKNQVFTILPAKKKNSIIHFILSGPIIQ